MDIKKKASQIRKGIKDLNWQLTSGLALSQKQRKAKEKQVDDLKKELANLKQQLTELKLRKMNIKLCLLY